MIIVVDIMLPMSLDIHIEHVLPLWTIHSKSRKHVSKSWNYPLDSKTQHSHLRIIEKKVMYIYLHHYSCWPTRTRTIKLPDSFETSSVKPIWICWRIFQIILNKHDWILKIYCYSEDFFLCVQHNVISSVLLFLLFTTII